jgi:hypothetical protein
MNVTIHHLTPPPRRPQGQRARRALTPLQEIELWSWYKAKKFLGSIKGKARELKVTHSTLMKSLERMRMREARDKRALSMGAGGA